MTCTPTPQQILPPDTVTFAIQTFASGGPASTSARIPRHRISPWPQAAAGTALACILFLAVPLKRRKRVFNHRGPGRSIVLLLLLAPLVYFVTSCNGSSVLASNGTPLGVATLKVIATAYVDNAVTSQTVYFTVNVQP
jgi:hypothetical protein